jgi:arylsulfatase A-like enzyme
MYKPRTWIVVTAAVLVSGCAPADEIEPNIVFILVDDLGWVDTGVYGSSFYETPNIDQLAAEGARFAQFYTASPVCSPTRASIMTGKYPARLNITNWIGGEQQGRLLQAEYERELFLEEITFGDAFQAIGYATAYIGKWHLGDEEYHPEFQGFDLNVAGHHAGQPGSYFFPYRNERQPRFDVPDLEDGEAGEYLTDRLTAESLRFIEANRDRPFLLVLSHYAVHTPLESKQVLTDKYEAKAGRLPPLGGPPFLPEGTTGTSKQRQDHAVYAGMIQSTDESVGSILDKLEELGIDDRTIVVFLSDNGGLSTLMNGSTRSPTSNLPLRAGKGWLYEGGIRSPLIVKWPGVTEPGRVIDDPAITNDLFPTLMEMAEVPLSISFEGDALSLAPLLQGATALDRDALYWHFPHYHGSGNTPTGAVRAGDYKLIEWFEDGRVELYNLADDIGETTDLATQMPEKADELLAMLRAWRARVDARMPTPNPDSLPRR